MYARYINAEHLGHSGRTLIGVFSSVYSENVILSFLFSGGSTGLSATDACPGSLSVMSHQYDWLPCGTEQDGSLC